MRDNEIFVSVVKGTPLRVVADKNCLSCTRVVQLFNGVVKMLIRNDPHLEHVKHKRMADIRERKELWLWAIGQLEQS